MVAAAVIAGAVIGGVASNSAAKKGSKSAKDGLKQTSAMAAQSRGDAIDLFGQSRDSAQAGIGSALNFYQDTAQAKNQPMIQGNMMAQQTVGQGGIQANNAILGLPVDMSFANNPQQVQADYSAITKARLPQLGDRFGDSLKAQEVAATEAAAAKKVAARQAKKDNRNGEIIGLLTGTGSMGGKRINKFIRKLGI